MKQHPTALISPNSEIGEGTNIWAFCNIQGKVGKNCNICDRVFIEEGAVVGDNVTIKNGVSVWSGVTIEDNAFIGPNAIFTNDLNPISQNKDWKLTNTIIGKGASIGAGAIILAGCDIGEHALVGAGSVVTKKIVKNHVVIGNPARPIGVRCICGSRKASIKGKNSYNCHDCGTDF